MKRTKIGHSDSSNLIVEKDDVYTYVTQGTESLELGESDVRWLIAALVECPGGYSATMVNQMRRDRLEEMLDNLITLAETQSYRVNSVCEEILNAVFPSSRVR